MKNKISIIVYIIISYFFFSADGHSQVIKDPIAFMRKSDPGHKLGIWELDLNQNGLSDMLITITPDSKEIADEKEDSGRLYDENQTTFAVFIKQNGGEYRAINEMDEIDNQGKRDIVTAGVFILLNKCYIGQIDEVKRYGIVSIENIDMEAPSGHGLPVQGYRIVCYYMKNGRLNERCLTGDMSYDAKDPIYDKYLSDNKLAKVTLKTVE